LSQLDKEADYVLTKLKEERDKRREVIKTLDEQLSQINQVVSETNKKRKEKKN